jgi:hypothetical protein
MVKKAILFLAVALGIAGGAQAQLCGTSEQQAVDMKQYPQIAELEKQIRQEMMNLDVKSLGKSKDADGVTLHIPVVVHVIHDYGADNYFTDNEIYQMMDDINRVYRAENPDLANVIAPFKKYIGNPQIQFHLATKDPLGRPTKGITRRQSYLTKGGDNQAKFDLWAPDSYINIWIIEYIGRPIDGGFVAAYATPPSTAAVLPYIDGVIGRAKSANANKTIAHELGHILNLMHPWGSGPVSMACGDDDVDDTPPTTGHFGTPPNNSPYKETAGGDCNNPKVLYDTTCIHTRRTIGKIFIDSLAAVADMQVHRGIEFRALSSFRLDSVDVYPSTLGQPFQIKLLKQRAIGSSEYDTMFTHNEPATQFNSKTYPRAQSVVLGFSIPVDTLNYKLVLTENPGLRRDTANTLFPRDIPLVISIGNSASDNRYNYFYNWRITHGYVMNGVDYPDTTNTQNIMDYADCPINFTDGQVKRMRAALASSAGNRNRLVSELTALKTGIAVFKPGTNPADSIFDYGMKLDLPPVPDFSVERGSGINPGSHYMCANGVREFIFRNRSWGDTIESVQFEFAGANPQTSTNTTSNIAVKTSQPGWMTVKLTAKGNNSGSTTIERQPVYAADPNYKINPMAGYFQEFNADGDMDKWPMFNYYNNSFKWQATNVGFYDNTGIMYTTWDARAFPQTLVGTPQGDFDDFFTPAFDLSGMTSGDCNLNFMYSGAYRTTNILAMNDTMEIAYSTNCGESWQTFSILGKQELANKGNVPIAYAPQYQGDWALKSINIPQNARSGQTFFRFRYRPGVDPASQVGTGNNFYMDRINVSPFPLGVNTIMGNEKNISLVPNPTTDATNLVINNSGNNSANISVVDMTGKVIYRSSHSLINGVNRIEIPAAAIQVKGIYMVQVQMGNNVQTEKLVKY